MREKFLGIFLATNNGKNSTTLNFGLFKKLSGIQRGKTTSGINLSLRYFTQEKASKNSRKYSYAFFTCK